MVIKVLLVLLALLDLQVLLNLSSTGSGETLIFDATGILKSVTGGTGISVTTTTPDNSTIVISSTSSGLSVPYSIKWPPIPSIDEQTQIVNTTNTSSNIYYNATVPVNMTLTQVHFIIQSGSIDQYGIAIYDGHSISSGPNNNTLLGQGPINYTPTLFPGSVIINMVPINPGLLTFTAGQNVCVSFSKDSTTSIEFCGSNAMSLSNDIWTNSTEWVPNSAPNPLVQTGNQINTRICMNFYGY